jgi:hypothetical protein
MEMNWHLVELSLALLETALVDVQMPPLATTTLKPTLTMAPVPNLMNAVNAVVLALRTVHATVTATSWTSAAFVAEQELLKALATATAILSMHVVNVEVTDLLAPALVFQSAVALASPVVLLLHGHMF